MGVASGRLCYPAPSAGGAGLHPVSAHSLLRHWPGPDMVYERPSHQTDCQRWDLPFSSCCSHLDPGPVHVPLLPLWTWAPGSWVCLSITNPAGIRPGFFPLLIHLLSKLDAYPGDTQLCAQIQRWIRDRPCSGGPTVWENTGRDIIMLWHIDYLYNTYSCSMLLRTFTNLFFKKLISPLHVRLNNILDEKIYIKWIRRMALFHTFANLSNVWLSIQVDFCILFGIQSLVIWYLAVFTWGMAEMWRAYLSNNQSESGSTRN